MKFPLLIVPAAGRATRMGDLCKDKSKCLLEVNGRPILRHILDYWSDYADLIRVVVMPDQVERVKGWAVYDYDDVLAKPDLLNLPQAIAWTFERGGPQFDNCVVVLGDCLVRGEFAWDHLTYPYNGIGVTDGDTDFARSYAVQARGGMVGGVIEKPRLGMGVYFFHHDVMPILRDADTITGAVATITERVGMKLVPFTGQYLNITYPIDLERWPA